MLGVKSVVILKANPGILKRGGEIKIWLWLCVERESYLEFGSRARMRKIGKKYCEAKRDAKRVAYMAMNQKASEMVGEVDSYFNGCELVRTAKQGVGEKLLGVSCLKHERGAVKVSVDDQKRTCKEHMRKLLNVENRMI